MTLILGILNVTPDSFSDGGRWQEGDAAVQHGLDLVADGADVVDVGGESTRPGAQPVDPLEEQRRVLPVIRELVAEGVRVSIDTVHAATAAAALAAGAEFINDVSAGASDPAMPAVIADTKAPIILMHSRGPADATPVYRDVVAEVRDELARRVDLLLDLGADPAQFILDPGLGFAKDAGHNWALLRGLPQLAALGYPVLVGASRKRFLAALLPYGAPVQERDLPTAVVSALAAQAGAWGVRVHDAAGSRRALDVVEAWNGTPAAGRMEA